MRRTVIAAVAAGTLLLAACSDDDEHPPPPPPPVWDDEETDTATATAGSGDTETATETAAPDTDVETETATAAPTEDDDSEIREPGEYDQELVDEAFPDGPPQMPAEALEDSREGIDAFARHYIDVWNYAAMTGDTTTMRDLSTDNCELCSRMIGGIEDNYSNGVVTDAPRMTIGYTSTTSVPERNLTTMGITDGSFSYVGSDGVLIDGPRDPMELVLQFVVVDSEGARQVQQLINAGDGQ